MFDLNDQVAVVPLETSFACRWVFQWLRRWIVLTTPVRKICTSFPLRGSRVDLTVFLQLASETWWWPPWRRESQIWGKRFCLLSSFVNVSHGAERTVSSCTLKVTLIWFMFIIWFSILFIYLFMIKGCFCNLMLSNLCSDWLFIMYRSIQLCYCQF